MATLINSGSVEDIRWSLWHRIKDNTITIAYLNKEIREEKKGSNRTSVIKLLEAAKRKLIKNK